MAWRFDYFSLVVGIRGERPGRHSHLVKPERDPSDPEGFPGPPSCSTNVMRDDVPRPVVDRDLCIGCEMCVEICSDVFEMDDEGISRVRDPEACDACDCQEAIDACPVEAIIWED